MVTVGRPESKASRFSILKLFKFLEHPRYPSVGPHLHLLDLAGLWHFNPESKLTRFKQFLLYIILIYFFSQYVKCCINFNTASLMLLLKYAAFHLGIAKTCFFRKDYKKWVEVIDYMSDVERKEIDEDDAETKEILYEYIKRSRRVTYFFWALAVFSNYGIFTEPYQQNEINNNGTSVYVIIFDAYFPMSNEPPGYYVSMCIQTIVGYIVTAYIVGWDTLVCTIMIYFAGQLKVSRLKCSRMIVIQNAEQSHVNIAACHRYHTNLVKYQKIFNALISPPMFIYLIVISVSFGVCIIQITQIKDDLTTLVSSSEFVIACLIQLLLFYWHSNEVTEESANVSYGSFESTWMEMDNKCQREVALLGLTTNKRLVFTAGPFNEMSLKTFVDILRLTYSFFTLLNKTK